MTLIYIPGEKTRPEDFGAVGNGRDDDSDAFSKAMNRAEETKSVLWLSSNQVYAIRKRLIMPVGIRGVVGNGATVKILGNASKDAGFEWSARGTSKEQAQAPFFLSIQFDCNNRSAVPIHVRGGHGANVQKNRILNLAAGVGIAFSPAAGGDDGPFRHKVASNTIDLNSSKVGVGISVRGKMEGDRASSDLWAEFGAIKVLGPAEGLEIIDNVVKGGYYGISLGATASCKVEKNLLQENTRSISMQGGSSENRVAENTLTDSISSAVHLAYGSSRNLIAKNRIKTAIGRGEGLLQSYVGSRENRFLANTVSSDGPGNKYLVYCAIDSSGCIFERNVLNGNVSNAYIGIESGWNSGLGLQSSRSQRRSSKATEKLAREGLCCVQILRNTLSGRSSVPAVFLGQISNIRTVGELNKISIIGNDFGGLTEAVPLEILETYGKVSELEFLDNIPPKSGKTMSLPRGREHFTKFQER